MDVNINDQSSWEKTVEVTMSHADLETDFEEAYKEYKKKIQLGGFRKGKVPIQMIKQIFGKEIEMDVAEKKIPDILTEIGDKYNYITISPAKVEEFSFDKEAGLKFKAKLEIIPNIELGTYKGVQVEKSIYNVDEEDVNEALEKLRDEQAEMVNIDEEAKFGHFVVADFQQIDETDVPLIGNKYENRYIELKEEGPDDKNDLASQLIGCKAGESRKINITFMNESNQQQTDRFEVKIKEIQEKRLPVIDDEFAKDVGDYENLDELKSGLHEKLIMQHQNQNEQLLEENIINEIVKLNEFEVPEPMINNYLDNLIKNFSEHSNEQVDQGEIRTRFRADAIKYIKWSMIKDKINDIEKLEIVDAEVDEHIDNLLKENEKNSLQIRNYYRKQENKERLKNELLDKKLFHFLIENAEVKEKQISRNDLKQKSKIIT